MADTGHGATITFGTSGFTASFISFGGFSQERPALDDSGLATTDFRTMVPGDLSTPGSFTAEFFFDPDEQPPINAVAETITLTYPVPSGSSNGATAAASGFLTSWEAPTLVTDELMKATATVQWADGPTWTDAS